jgi:uncharacterized protein YecE (DUF72 family)
MTGPAPGRLRAGTSSWSEKSWVGPFYPEGLRPADFLAWYATRFDTVEADVTYYRIPERRMVEGWARKLPEGFALAAKFPRTVVHCGEGPRPDGARVAAREHVAAEVELFLERMSHLGAKCGPLVLQFPWFDRSVFPERAPFLERLDDLLASLPAAFRYAVEVRNRGWIDDELLALLRRHRTALVWTDLASMPHPADLARGLDIVTADFAYARLIGDRKLVDSLTDTFDRVVIDRSERLDRWAELLRGVLERVPETYAYANNHYAGHAPQTIRDLVERLGAARGGAPA